MMEQKNRKKGVSEGVLVRLPDDILSKLDEFRRSEDDIPTRPEMIRRILLSWIEQNSKK